MNQWIISNAPVLCSIAIVIFFIALYAIVDALRDIAYTNDIRKLSEDLKQISKELKKLSDKESSDE